MVATVTSVLDQNPPVFGSIDVVSFSQIVVGPEKVVVGVGCTVSGVEDADVQPVSVFVKLKVSVQYLVIKIKYRI